MSSFLAGTAFAQSATPAPQAQQAQAPAVEEVVVTATRIVRDGYEAPTPTTVIGVEQIEAAGANNISDYVNQLPSLAGSNTLRTGNGGSSGGTGGISSSNLRNLGASRTLVLLDGHRVVGASFSLSPDVGEFPQALISRVDVVTGGASAAWGSDAVSGVVNFVIDKKFVGFKAEAIGSVTTYGDDRQAKLTLTAGVPFGDDRGHFLVSGEHVISDGAGLSTTRPWYKGYKLIPYSIAATPAGLPQYNVLPAVGSDNEAPGGIIANVAANGPLKGLIFGPGGSVANYNFGTIDVAPFNSGGDWRMTDVGYVSNLEDSERKDSLYLRSSFDVADDVNLWIEGMYGDVHSRYNCCAEFSRTFTIKSDNPFIPASVLAAMQANKMTSIVVGNTMGDLGYVQPDNRRIMKRVAVGAEGKAMLFDSNWNWSAYITRGTNHLSNINDNQSITLNLNRAVQAVRDPATGAIRCFDTTGGNCVPYNVFGVGVNSQAALNFIRGRPELHVTQTQDVGSASFNGEPFSDWAGPISLAGGIEYRREAAVAKNEGPISDGNGYFSGNFHATQGSYHDVEGFLETVIPLAKDTVWAKSFELNGAVRGTDYSLAGYVTTWKVGATWNPIDDIRLRATKSRDIRAPNLSDLFLAGQTNTQTVVDDFAPNAGKTFTVARHTFGNTALKPETADTTGLGFVLTPRFFPGFQASFDYYNIDIAGAIATPSNQIIMDYCFQGVTSLCQYIIRNSAGIPTDVNGLPVNIASQTSKGYDIEASYRVALDTVSDSLGGNLTLRALGTHIISNKTNQFGVIHEGAGENSGSSISWRWLMTATYDLDPMVVNLALRTMSNGTLNNDYIECTSGCPLPTTLHPTVNNNHIPGVNYWDFGITYKLTHAGDGGPATEVFLKVDNVTNANPPPVATAGGITQIGNGVNPSIYDVLGRNFHLGVRLKM